MREEDFHGVVVNDARQLLWVFIPCSGHHLQYLSETNTDVRENVICLDYNS